MNCDRFFGLDCGFGVRCVSTVFLVVVMASGLCRGQGAGVELYRDGAARCVVVVGRDATSTERHAAEELQRYLGAVGGSAPLLATEGEGAVGSAIPVDVGNTARGIALREKLDVSGESFAVAVDGAGVTVVGGTDRGTLFGVYRFLETRLGCRWLAPDIEEVPPQPSLTLPEGTRVLTPAFGMRTFVGRRSTAAADWGIKVGMNGFYSPGAAAINGNAYYLPDAIPGCHTYYLVIPADRYFDAHPEWFPLIDGERRRGNKHGVQLCVTAPGLADEFARNIIKIFDDDPTCRVTSISPNDGRGWCECDACQELDRRLCGARTIKQGLAGDRPFRGDRVFWFANEVAKRVAKTHPDKLLLVLAYINYAEPPDTVRPLPNVVPYLCHYAPADYSRAIADPSSEANAQFNALLVKWAERAPHLLFYSYVSKSMWWRLPRPVMPTFAADVKYLYSLGIRRYYCQSTLTDWRLDGPLYYVIARLLWDPSLDPREIAADWAAHMFGDASPAMLAFYDSVEQSVKASGQSYSERPPAQVPGLYAPSHLAAAKAHLADALRLASSEEVRERIEGIRTVFDYGCLAIQGIEEAERFRAEADPDAAKASRAHLTQALELVSIREVRRYLDSLNFLDEFGVVSSGFGKAETRGERRCWNTDETGPGDERSGWATFIMPVARADKPVRVEMDVWGESDLSSIVVNTGGLGRSYAGGGLWTPVKPLAPLSGEPQWETLVFDITPEVLPAGAASVRVGMGGGDSQIWISAVRVSQP
jgi:hypothetical protein